MSRDAWVQGFSSQLCIRQKCILVFSAMVGICTLMARLHQILNRLVGNTQHFWTEGEESAVCVDLIDAGLALMQPFSVQMCVGLVPATRLTVFYQRRYLQCLGDAVGHFVNSEVGLTRLSKTGNHLSTIDCFVRFICKR